MRRAGRLHAPEVDALAAPTATGELELRAPSPGIFVPSLGPGDLVVPGHPLGELVVLGRATAVLAPRGAGGIAVRIATASHAVAYGEALVAVDPSRQLAAGAPGATADPTATSVAGLVFRAPTSGRFYGRSSPDKPPFIVEGSQLTPGVTICLLEVMKTFHRVTYSGAGLPDTARIARVLVSDGDDVNAGDPLLALE